MKKKKEVWMVFCYFTTMWRQGFYFYFFEHLKKKNPKYRTFKCDKQSDSQHALLAQCRSEQSCLPCAPPLHFPPYFLVLYKITERSEGDRCMPKIWWEFDFKIRITLQQGLWLSKWGNVRVGWGGLETTSGLSQRPRRSLSSLEAAEVHSQAWVCKSLSRLLCGQEELNNSHRAGFTGCEVYPRKQSGTTMDSVPAKVRDHTPGLSPQRVYQASFPTLQTEAREINAKLDHLSKENVAHPTQHLPLEMAVACFLLLCLIWCWGLNQDLLRAKHTVCHWATVPEQDKPPPSTPLYLCSAPSHHQQQWCWRWTLVLFSLFTSVEKNHLQTKTSG